MGEGILNLYHPEWKVAFSLQKRGSAFKFANFNFHFALGMEIT